MRTWKPTAVNLVVLSIVSSLASCEGLYVRVRQGKGKCFIEMLQEHEVLVLRYRSPDQSPLPPEPEVCFPRRYRIWLCSCGRWPHKCGARQALRHHVGVLVNVVNYEGKVYSSRLDQEGRISFAATFDGEHRICLRSMLFLRMEHV